MRPNGLLRAGARPTLDSNDCSRWRERERKQQQRERERKQQRERDSSKERERRREREREREKEREREREKERKKERKKERESKKQVPLPPPGSQCMSHGSELKRFCRVEEKIFQSCKSGKPCLLFCVRGALPVCSQGVHLLFRIVFKKCTCISHDSLYRRNTPMRCKSVYLCVPESTDKCVC